MRNAGLYIDLAPGLATSSEYMRCERYHGRRPGRTELDPTPFLPRSRFFLVCLLCRDFAIARRRTYAETHSDSLHLYRS